MKCIAISSNSMALTPTYSTPPAIACHLLRIPPKLHIHVLSYLTQQEQRNCFKSCNNIHTLIDALQWSNPLTYNDFGYTAHKFGIAPFAIVEMTRRMGKTMTTLRCDFSTWPEKALMTLIRSRDGRILLNNNLDIIPCTPERVVTIESILGKALYDEERPAHSMTSTSSTTAIAPSSLSARTLLQNLYCHLLTKRSYTPNPKSDPNTLFSAYMSSYSSLVMQKLVLLHPDSETLFRALLNQVRLYGAPPYQTSLGIVQYTQGAALISVFENIRYVIDIHRACAEQDGRLNTLFDRESAQKFMNDTFASSIQQPNPTPSEHTIFMNLSAIDGILASIPPECTTRYNELMGPIPSSARTFAKHLDYLAQAARELHCTHTTERAATTISDFPNAPEWMLSLERVAQEAQRKAAVVHMGSMSTSSSSHTLSSTHPAPPHPPSHSTP